MDPFSGLLCCAAKIGAWSHWDHVGIVVPMIDNCNDHPATSNAPARLGLLEANLKGITLRPLAERLARTSSSRIAVRRLVRPCDADTEARFLDRLSFVSDHLLKKRYTDDLLSLASALVMSHWSPGMCLGSVNKA